MKTQYRKQRRAPQWKILFDGQYGIHPLKPSISYVIEAVEKLAE